jgi:hypothetical protein
MDRQEAEDKRNAHLERERPQKESANGGCGAARDRSDTAGCHSGVVPRHGACHQEHHEKAGRSHQKHPAHGIRVVSHNFTREDHQQRISDRTADPDPG